MKQIALLAFTVLLAACASSPGVIPIGGGNYSLMQRSYAPHSSLQAVKVEAYKEATEFCGKQGKTLNVTGSTDIPRALSQFAETEVRFTCGVISAGFLPMRHF